MREFSPEQLQQAQMVYHWLLQRVRNNNIDPEELRVILEMPMIEFLHLSRMASYLTELMGNAAAVVECGINGNDFEQVRQEAKEEFFPTAAKVIQEGWLPPVAAYGPLVTSKPPEYIHRSIVRLFPIDYPGFSDYLET